MGYDNLVEVLDVGSRVILVAMTLFGIATTLFPARAEVLVGTCTSGHWGSRRSSDSGLGGLALATGYALADIRQRLHDFETVARPAGEAQPVPGGTGWGRWYEPSFCPPLEYVCGLRQRVERPQGGSADDTSVNNIQFYCCPLAVPDNTDAAN